MFQDEKTTELDLNQHHSKVPAASLQQARWTEKNHFSVAAHSATSLTPAASRRDSLEAQTIPWLIKLGAAVTILILSLWLF